MEGAVNDDQTQPPAPRPCESCPYRQDVPSGIWSPSEYEKLPLYDKETMWQPPKLFHCHQTATDSPRRRICAGWAGCHDGYELLALRIAVTDGLITHETAEITVEYSTSVPLFASGAAAAAHGLRDIENPGPAASLVAAKIRRVRKDIQR